MAKGLFGEKAVTGRFPVRFNNLSKKDEKGNYQVELEVPIGQVKELEALLYSNDDLIEANKKTAKQKAPTPLHSKLKVYDEEAGEYEYEEDGVTPLLRDDAVVFRFKTKRLPKIQFHKSIPEKDRTLELGFGSEVAVSTNLYLGTAIVDKKEVPYALLSLNGVRIYSIVEKGQREAFEEDDDFEDADEFADADESGDDENGDF